MLLRLWRKLRSSLRREPRVTTVSKAGLRTPANLGDVWGIVQKIAEEEDPRYGRKNVVEHVNTSAEALKDIDRWLHIYQRRLDASHEYSFPEHHGRHRGYCLVPRNWPDGLEWEAFSEETWFRARVPPQPDEGSLIETLDAFLDERERSGSGA